MASIGRGRGRGWVQPLAQESALRRPGQPASPKSCELEELIDAIYNNVRVDAHIPDEGNVTINNLAQVVINDIGEENLINRLWEQVLEDRCFASKILRTFRFWQQRTLPEPDFRRIMRRGLCSKMQKSYEAREELCVGNIVHLSNLTWCLGTSLEHDVLSLNILSPALVDCMDRLLDNATEENIETVAVQILLNGKKISGNVEIKDMPTSVLVGLEGVVNKARTVLVNRNVSSRTRALLLLIVDLANQDYEPLNGDLLEFYSSIFGGNCSPETEIICCNGRELYYDNYVYKLLRDGGNNLKQQKNIKVTTTTTKKSAVESPKAPTPVENSSINELPLKETRKMNLGPKNAVSAPVPRAIRGSGAGDNSKDSKKDKKSPRSKNDKSTDEQLRSSKTNTSSKVYGHDDRFDIDYE